jgi:hypothetical protein
MTARALYSTTHDEFDSGAQYASEALFSGERICEPGLHRARRSKLRKVFGIAILLGGGYAYLNNREVCDRWLSAGAAVVASAMQRSAPEPAVAEVPPVPEQLQKAHEVADAPGVGAGTAVPAPPITAPKDDAETIPESPEQVDAPATPLPPPTFDTSDPLKKRAVAAGLHPDLSQALLKKLTAADYRNAGIAIQKALAETTDNDVFVWPRPLKANLAQFEVHFVRGATDCRRYVVVVTMERWSTTALPMEKCGVAAHRAAQKGEHS